MWQLRFCLLFSLASLTSSLVEPGIRDKKGRSTSSVATINGIAWHVEKGEQVSRETGKNRDHRGEAQEELQSNDLHNGYNQTLVELPTAETLNASSARLSVTESASSPRPRAAVTAVNATVTGSSSGNSQEMSGGWELKKGSHSHPRQQQTQPSASQVGARVIIVKPGTLLSYSHPHKRARVDAYDAPTIGELGLVGPDRVISNVYGGKVRWWKDDVVSYTKLMGLMFVCYPVWILAFLFTLMLLVSICMQPSSELSLEILSRQSHILRVEDLAPMSQAAYSWWVSFCYFVPIILLVGTCYLVFLATCLGAKEIYIVLMTISTFYFFSMSTHQISFVPFLLSDVSKVDACKPEDLVSDLRGTQAAKDHAKVRHWVIIPNYKEHVETLNMTLDTIAQSTLAKDQINIMLAMEEREEGANKKAYLLMEKWRNCFLDIVASHHPRDLVHDPPGKASNVAWASKQLATHLAKLPDSEFPEEACCSKDAYKVDNSMVILTIADADSCFHQYYFEALTQDFVRLEPEERRLNMWQAPILHVKNYHAQPSLVAVGSILTGLVEAAGLADPNVIRFPYSTYSLSYHLAEAVGGWDVQWIAEDWHMGIKCYLLTLGQMEIRSLPAPVINYTPEDPEGRWWQTLWERFKQAKRHALGFSDIAYIFMTLPLIFQYLMAVDSSGENISRFPKVCAKSLFCIIRLVNTHVSFGVLLTYSGLSLVSGVALGKTFALRWGGLTIVLSAVTAALLCIAAGLFVAIHAKMKPRIDAPADSHRFLYNSRLCHFFYILPCLVILGPVFFMAIGYCAWVAAFQCAVTSFRPQDGFRYDLAPKPSRS